MLQLNRGEIMEKHKNAIITVAVIVFVVILTFVLSILGASKYYKTIDESEYKSIIKKDAIIYIGDNEKIEEALEEVTDSKEIKVYAISKVKEHDSNVIEIWKNGKLVSSSNFSEMEKPTTEKTKKNVTMDEYLKQITKEGYNFMVIGRTGCGYCEMYEESLNDLLKTYSIDVYYLNIYDITDEDYNKLVNSDSFFSTNEWGTPTSMIYKDGELVKIINGYRESSKLLSELATLFVEQKIVEN